MTDYWIKCVNREGEGDTIELVEVTEELRGTTREKMPRSALIHNLKEDKTVKTAHKRLGRWREGEEVLIQDDRWITVEHKEGEVNQDDLGGLQACKI